MEQLIEYLVIIFIGLGVLFGLVKGFVKIFFSWFSIVLGAIVALNFSYGLTKVFFPEHSGNMLLIFLIGIVLFSIVYLIINQGAHACSEFFVYTNIKSLDHILGAVLGGCQMMLIVGLCIYWMTIFGWIDMSSYPVSMFSVFWAEKIILLVGTRIDVVNKLL